MNEVLQKKQQDRLIEAVRAGLGNIVNSVRGDLVAPRGQLSPLDGTVLANGSLVEVIGIPEFVSDISQHAAYGLTETGWYAFARVAAQGDTKVTADLEVTGADGYIATAGADHVDIAVRFDVAVQSRAVSINWGSYTDSYVFHATDLAVRNLDYRTTFYLYDIAPYRTWEYAPTPDAVFKDYVENDPEMERVYFTRQDGEFVATATPRSYVLTEDDVFAQNTTYYVIQEGEYVAAEDIVVGDPVPENTYYVRVHIQVPTAYFEMISAAVYTLTADTTFVSGKTYYTLVNSEYVAATVTAGTAVTANTYYERTAEAEYAPTADATFDSGKTYYTHYVEATVTAEHAVTAETYFEKASGTGYVLTADTTFVSGKTYYTYSAGDYTADAVTAGAAVPTIWFVHSGVRFEGMPRNITYKYDEIIDCPFTLVLPEIEDDSYGSWFEFRFRLAYGYSGTFETPEGVRMLNAGSVVMTKGLDVLDVNYSDLAGLKARTLVVTRAY